MSASQQEFDYLTGLMGGVLWRYDSAQKLIALMQAKQAWYLRNCSDFWNYVATSIFDLSQADEFGLQVWARILQVPLQVVVPPSTAVPFGFGTHNENYEHGDFSSQSNITRLTIYQQRLVLQLRYFRLTTRPSIPEINRILAYLFKDLGSVYAIDNYNMQMTYVFTFTPDPQLLYVMQNFDVLPRPSGVQINFYNSLRDVFGFGTDNKNFTHGDFLPEAG